MGDVTARGQGAITWQHQLTDEERRLRDLAYPLIDPPYDRNQWYSALGELGLGSRVWPYPDRSEYATRLFDRLPLADRALQQADRGHPQRRDPARSVL